MSKEHKARALAVHCIDFRFQKQIEDDLETRGLKNQFDRIAWPGASKDFDNVSKACKLSIRLHNPDLALIYEHEDCGAYGEDDSLEAHRTNANRLNVFLKESKPEIKVITLMVTFEGIKEI